MRATVASASPPRDVGANSRAEYERRIHRVVAHIDRHLEEALDLDTLAAVAHFSSFHFHRLFRAWTGETLGDYVRRRRVETGALRLVTQPGSSVLEVALAVGFGSGEAFARAFKLRFGASPSAWRAAPSAIPVRASAASIRQPAAPASNMGFPQPLSSRTRP